MQLDINKMMLVIGKFLFNLYLISKFYYWAYIKK